MSSAVSPVHRTFCRELIGTVSRTVSLVVLTIIEVVKKIFFLLKEGLKACFKIETKPKEAEVEEVELSSMPKELYEDLIVNPKKISMCLDPIDPEMLAKSLEGAEPPVAIDEILTHFDAQFEDEPDENFAQDEWTTLNKEQARYSISEHFINYLNQPQTDKRDTTIAESTKSFLMAVIFHLRDPKIPSTLKKEVLKKLCVAGLHCKPRKQQQAYMSYLDISNQTESVREILLQGLQDLKEKLFLEHYCMSEQSPHVLNWIRKSVGKQLGLNTSPIFLNDPYIKSADPKRPWRKGERRTTGENYCLETKPEQFLKAFDLIYTKAPGRVLNGMANWIRVKMASNQAFTEQVVDFIKEVKGMPKDGPVPEDCFDSSNGQLTDQGVRFLMIHFEFLTVKQ